MRVVQLSVQLMKDEYYMKVVSDPSAGIKLPAGFTADDDGERLRGFL